MKERNIWPLALLLLLSLAICLPAYADIIYVKPGGPGPDGKSWATAFATIQAGVNAAASEDEKTVWVQKGTYTENITVPQKVKVYGGFKGDESPLDANVYANRDFVTNESIVQPSINTNSIFSALMGVRIDGFTIQSGKADTGGAIKSTGTGLTVAYCIIKNNESRLGAGIYASAGSLFVTKCTFDNNKVASTAANPSIAQGAGIWADSASLTVNDSKFTAQTATVKNNTGSTAQGGAIWARNGSPIYIERCSFTSCSAGGQTVVTWFAWGGAVYASGASTYVKSCLFNKCSALGKGDPKQSYGGAVAFQNPGTINVINNTFVANAVMPQAGSISDIDRAYGLGAALYINGSSNANIINNIITDSRGTAVVNDGMTVVFNYNLLWHNAGGDIFGFNFPVSADKNIMKNPQFRNALGGDYHILYGSPARDAGQNGGVVPSTDIDGENRPNYSGPPPAPVPAVVDIGADEFVDTRGGPTYGKANNDTSAAYSNLDGDTDKIDNNFDNCVATSNPTQVDSNGDKIGDSCQTIPAVYYVTPTGSDTNNGTTWATAFKTIQHAIDFADFHNQAGWVKNPEVWVKKGTYNENILIWHSVKVYGGWAGTELPTTLNVYSGRDVIANQTAINGSSTGSTVIFAHLPQDRYLTEPPKTAYALDQPVLDGFYITAGSAEIGGGVSIYKVTANLSTDRFVSNVAALGGGVYAYRSTGIIGDAVGPPPGAFLNGTTTIMTNTATGPVSYAGYGGGAYFERGGPILFGFLIQGNQALFGGAVAARKSAPQIIENVIGCLSSPNTAVIAGGKGGGIYLDTSPAIMNKDTIVDNIAAGPTSQGGGIWASNSKFWLKNSILAYNGAVSGGAIWVTGSVPSITYCDFFNNSVPVFTGITDPTAKNGNKYVDPLFMSRNACNYNLAANSPLIHAGDPADYGVNNRPNIGAYQQVDPPVTIGEAMKLGNGVIVEISGVVVTAVFPDCFYVEEVDRSAGIRVRMYDAPVSEGQIVNFSGVMTTLGGERQIIDAKLVSGAASNTIIAPFALTNRDLGGAPVSELTTGLADGRGACNLGLLVRTMGKVTSTSDTSFMIDDGSGVGVKVILPSAVAVPNAGALVTVTGIATLDTGSDSKPVRAIYARRGSDVLSLR